MGCTLNHTKNDFAQQKASIGRATPDEKFSKERVEKIREALQRTSQTVLVSILDNENHPAYKSVSKLLAISVERNPKHKMTDKERQVLPKAFLTILKDHPDAMGLFKAAPEHYGPGAAAVQHFFEILGTAALKTKSFQTLSGKKLMISNTDRVDFGIKMARDYAQPKRFGTIEADVLIHKEDRTIAIDNKFSRIGKYNSISNRQLSGIRTAFRDEKVKEFHFVTNNEFGKGFKEKVTAMNLEIAKDYAAKHNRFYYSKKAIDIQYLATEERTSTPPGKIALGFFNEYNDEVNKFIQKYNISQIELCEHVNYPGT